MRPESLEFLRDICNTPSPSGYEEKAAELFRQYTSFADKHITDVHGNVAAILNPDAEMKVMLAGHMDEIGFQVNYIDDKGFIYFRGIGGHDSMVPLGQRVTIWGSSGEVLGVIGRKPIHLLESSEKDKRPELHDLTIDIGAASREEAERHVAIGDCITYTYGFQEVLGGRAIARAFDNRVGTFAVAEALRLLKEGQSLNPNVGVYAVATVQEEIGLRGARTAAGWIGSQSGIAVDVDFAIDHPGVSPSRYGALDIGKGPSITRGPNVNPMVFKMLRDAAESEGIPYQVAAEPGGTGTDANAMQIAGGGMATGLVGIPLRYMHTPCELISLEDASNCARLMAGYCASVTPETDFRPRL